MVNIRESLITPSLPVEPIVVEAPKGNKIRIEYGENNELGLYGASAYWGLRIVTAEIRKNFLERGIELGDQGFEAIYTYPEGLSVMEMEEWEIQALVNTVETLSEQSGISLDKIGLFALGCGTPIGDDFVENIADRLGFPSNQPKFEVSTACNSGARTHAKIYEYVDRYPELEQAYVLLLAHEGLRRLIPSPYDTSKADPFSLLVFGNATAAMIFQPKNMRKIVSITEEQEDTRGFLAATETYTINKSPDAPLIQVFDGGMKERIRLPTPPAGKIVNLDALHTTIDLGNFGGNGLKATINFHDQAVSDPTNGFENRPIDLIIAHQPSRGMLERIRRVAGYSNSLLIPFLGRYGIYGNSSGATSLVAFTKFIPTFRPGMHIAHVGIGAGMQFSATVVEFNS